MKQASEIRRARLAQIVKEAGSQVAVAARLGKDKNQVYQWLLPPEKESARNIGPRSARRIETVFNKPPGWMDNEDEQFTASDEPSPNRHAQSSYAARLDVPILAQAVMVIGADEAVNGPYPAEKHAALLLDLYDKIAAGEAPMELVAKLTQKRSQGDEHGTTEVGSR